MSRDEVIIPINETFNGYSWAKEIFESWDVYDQVVGHKIHDALSNWSAHVDKQSDQSGEDRKDRIEKWDGIYDTIDKLEQENYDIDCNTQAKAEELLRVLGLWTDSDGIIRRTYSPGYIAMGVSAANVPNHVGAYVIHKDDSGNWQHWGDRALDTINSHYYNNDPDGQRYRVDSPVAYIHFYDGADGDVPIAQVDVSQDYPAYGCEEVMVPDKFINLNAALKFLNTRLIGAKKYWNRSILKDKYKIIS